MVLSFSFGAFADSIVKDITAQLRPDFTISIDNENQTFKDANGKVVSPILYEGTIYLPIRAIGNIMGKYVEWDSNKKLVSLSIPKTENKSMYVNGKLTDLNALKINNNYFVNITKLQSALNNLELEIDDNGNLHIYERTGLGIIEVNGEKYVDFKYIADRYSAKGSEFFPYEWYSNQSEPSFLKTLPDSTKVGVGPRAELISINNYFYNSWFYKNAEFNQFLGDFLDIIKYNENYINEN